MPQRLIRDGILTSDTFHKLTKPQKLFFFYLMLKADDYGLYDARPSVLRANLFPLELDTVSIRDVQGYHAACVELGLVKEYTVEGKPYGKIEKFGQQSKSKPKHPIPPGEYSGNYSPPPRKGQSVTKRNEPSRGVTMRHLVGVGVGVGVGDEVGGEVGGERLVSSLPYCSTPKPEEVRAVMDALAIVTLSGDVLSECVSRFLDAMEASGWADARGVPIRNWEAAARNWARRYAERELATPNRKQTRRNDCNDPHLYD